MIKHIVMWSLRGESEAERRDHAQLVKTLFEGLRGSIPGMRTIEIGINCTAADYACDVVLYSEFDDEASLIAYATHPAHSEVRGKLGNLRTARHQVDYRIDAT